MSLHIFNLLFLFSVIFLRSRILRCKDADTKKDKDVATWSPSSFLSIKKFTTLLRPISLQELSLSKKMLPQLHKQRRKIGKHLRHREVPPEANKGRFWLVSLKRRSRLSGIDSLSCGKPYIFLSLRKKQNILHCPFATHRTTAIGFHRPGGTRRGETTTANRP